MKNNTMVVSVLTACSLSGGILGMGQERSFASVVKSEFLQIQNIAKDILYVRIRQQGEMLQSVFMPKNIHDEQNSEAFELKSQEKLMINRCDINGDLTIAVFGSKPDLDIALDMQHLNDATKEYGEQILNNIGTIAWYKNPQWFLPQRYSVRNYEIRRAGIVIRQTIFKRGSSSPLPSAPRTVQCVLVDSSGELMPSPYEILCYSNNAQ